MAAHGAQNQAKSRQSSRERPLERPRINVCVRYRSKEIGEIRPLLETSGLFKNAPTPTLPRGTQLFSLAE